MGLLASFHCPKSSKIHSFDDEIITMYSYLEAKVGMIHQLCQNGFLRQKQDERMSATGLWNQRP